ncbi:MAG: methionyl-tRNA formyltransferase [Bacteroidota bacterium]
MRIIFMGTPNFAVPSLNILAQSSHEVVAVVTAPDRPAGRGRRLKASAVKEAAQKLAIPVLQPEKLRGPDFNARLQSLKPDLMVVVAFRMLPQMVWSLPRLGTFNLHASLLPDYRGAAPINWALINGEERTGATTFLIDAKIDTGNILLQRELKVPNTWNAGDLHDALMVMGAELVLETTEGLDQGTLKPKPQDDTLFRHPAPKIFKEDCEIDWHKPAKELYDLIRGLSPYPGARTTFNGEALKVYGSEPLDHDQTAPPGTLMVDRTAKTLAVACGTGWLQLTTLQMAGKKRMSVTDLLTGYKGDWPDSLGPIEEKST